jgi:hypothetical protein
MPYNSQPPLSKKTKKNVFNYVLWLIELPMSEESEVTRYYNQFLDFAEPLLNVCILEDEECEELFWYGFHLDDHCLLLQQLFLKFPDQPLATYFHLQRVFPTACDIFSQDSNKMLQECQQALECKLQLKMYNNQSNPECGPPLSKDLAKKFMQDLEAKVRYHWKLTPLRSPSLPTLPVSDHVIVHHCCPLPSLSVL